MTPNNLLFCEHCRYYTKHTFVVNIGVCQVCIKTNKKPDGRFSILKWFKELFSNSRIDREAQRELIHPAKGRKDQQDQSTGHLFYLGDSDDSFLI